MSHTSAPLRTIPLAPKVALTLTLRRDALSRVRRHLVELDAAAFRSRRNLPVRDRWRALEVALKEAKRGEPLRVERQHADFYFSIRDAVMEWAGVHTEASLRCQVRTPSNLVFWVPKGLCNRLKTRLRSSTVGPRHAELTKRTKVRRVAARRTVR